MTERREQAESRPKWSDVTLSYERFKDLSQSDILRYTFQVVFFPILRRTIVMETAFLSYETVPISEVTSGFPSADQSDLHPVGSLLKHLKMPKGTRGRYDRANRHSGREFQFMRKGDNPQSVEYKTLTLTVFTGSKPKQC